MAGKLIVDTIDTDNAFITLNVQQSLIATMNVSGIYSNTGVKMIGANGTISNTAITGLVTAAQIATVANTQITGNITSSQITSNPTFYGNVSVTGAIGVGGATPTSNGSGITFPATQSASSDANTLDDYEEGTWTPSLGGNTTYSAQSAHYTKIGRMVFVSGVLIITAIGTGSTTAITGLPFTDGNLGGFKGGSVVHFLSIATSVVNIIPQIAAGSSQIDLKSLTAAATGVGSSAIFGSGARVDFVCSYFI